MKDSKQLNMIALTVESMLPDSHGFILLTFPLTGACEPEEGRLRYVSNGDREGCIKVMKAWLVHNGELEKPHGLGY